MEPSLDRLHEFVVIVDAGSVSEAARTLQIQRTSLSRRLTALETELGVRLMHRQTRRLVLTPAGEELYARASRVVSEAQAALEAVRLRDDVPRGSLRVSVPDGRMAHAGLFVSFAEEFPFVRLQVSLATRHVDLVAEGIDVAIRFGQITNESLVARRLWSTHSLPFAAPAYLERRGVPRNAEALIEHDCIVGFGGGENPVRTWPLLNGGSTPVSARFATSALDLSISAAERGLGLALLPRGAVYEQLRKGTLVPVLEGVVGSETPLNLVFVDREFMPPPMRLFIDRAIAYFDAWVAEQA
ncbi:MAG: LysR family transcriptional regulator [Nitrospira sp.]|nr:LysR family transcriptional regulator [Nitrospira sp.]